MNPWYERITGALPQQQQSYAPVFQNPLQMAQYIFQAMRNPVEFAKQQFPDLPDDIAYDSNKVLQYIQRTRGLSNNQLTQILSQYPRR